MHCRTCTVCGSRGDTRLRLPLSEQKVCGPPKKQLSARERPLVASQSPSWAFIKMLVSSQTIFCAPNFRILKGSDIQ